jgi:hypothetical protein
VIVFFQVPVDARSTTNLAALLRENA